MSFFRKKRKDRPIERVLRHTRVQQYLKVNRLRVSPPYLATEWNYWHIYENGVIKPIAADELLKRCLDWEREHRVNAAEEATAQSFYPLRPDLRHEIERLKKILAAHGKDFATNKGVPKARLRRVEQKLGYQLDSDLCAFYALTDGGPDNNEWFAVGIENPVPVNFMCLDDSLKRWQMYFENEEKNHEYGKGSDKSGILERDSRIGRGLWFPPQWWAFAVNDSDTTVMLDARPSPSGKVGQIITFYHDPDAFLCMGENFLDFFRKSNDFLEAGWDKIFPNEELV